LGIVLKFVFQKFLTDENLAKWGAGIKAFAKGIGVICTVGLAKLPVLKGLWNAIIEPYIIIFLRLLLINFLDGFVAGLETDNKSLKTD